MNTPTEKSEWTKDLGGVWFICLFVGAFTGGVGLFITIPIAIAYTIKVIWEEIKRKTGQVGGSSRYLAYGEGIENLDAMDIPQSGYSAAKRRA